MKLMMWWCLTLRVTSRTFLLSIMFIGIMEALLLRYTCKLYYLEDLSLSYLHDIVILFIILASLYETFAGSPLGGHSACFNFMILLFC